MSPAVIEGVVPILVTPFFEDGRIDGESLRSLIDFNVEAGVHGLGVALGSEVFKFTEAERQEIIGIVVDQVRKRVPVIINTGATGTDLAVHYGGMAEATGADALMIMPPTFFPVGADEIVDYYSTISRAVSIPIILQDIPQAPISPALALRIADLCPNVRYIKVETLPVTSKVADMAKAAKGRLTIFGGAGGGYFIEEMRRGARGTMPFCSQPEDFVAVWDQFQAGNEKAARKTFDGAFTGINRLGGQGGDIFYHVHKQLLVRKGVIRTAYVRSPTIAIDPITQREIDELLAELVPVAQAFGA
ncbi:MAG TPA: dihydrodipicolinate synthase family protein [Devosia sp.]